MQDLEKRQIQIIVLIEQNLNLIKNLSIALRKTNEKIEILETKIDALAKYQPKDI